MEFEEVSFTDLSEIQYKIWLSKSQRWIADVLLVKFVGQYRHGSGGNPDAKFMYAIFTAALEAWCPRAAILDLSELEYQWGDLLEMVLPNDEGDFSESCIPTAVVVGSKCKEEIRTLLKGVNSLEPLTGVEWVHESMTEAVKHVDHRLMKHDE